MKHITKSSEPPSLIIHRQQDFSTYENYRNKNDLKQVLLDDQGHICGYCMQRIKIDSMKIEHIKSQAQFPYFQLDFNNMICVCKGNEGAPRVSMHCDSFKEDSNLSYLNPVDRSHNCEDFIKYSMDGKIYSKNYDINNDLNYILNLNHQTLKNNRKAVYEGIFSILRRNQPNRWTKIFINNQISRFSKKINGEYSEYCMVIIYFLKKRI